MRFISGAESSTCEWYCNGSLMTWVELGVGSLFYLPNISYLLLSEGTGRYFVDSGNQAYFLSRAESS